MANKLKSMLNNQNEREEKIIFTFDSVESLEEFKNAIRDTGVNGKKVSGIKTIERVKIDGQSLYPLGKEEVVDSEVFINDFVEEKDVIFSNAFGERQVKMSCKYTNTGDLYLYNKDSVVRIEIFTDFKENSVSFSYSINPHNARFLEELRDAYLDAYGIIDYFVCRPDDLEANDVLEKFKNSVVFYSKIIAISKVLKIRILPLDLFEDPASMSLVDEWYYLLCKKVAIRTNDRINDITNANIQDHNPDLQPGMRIVTSFQRSETHRFFGHTIKLEKVFFAFNILVKSVEKDVNSQQVIRFTDDENGSMYISYKGFLSNREASKETTGIMDKIEEYKSAKLLQDMVKEECPTDFVKPAQ